MEIEYYVAIEKQSRFLRAHMESLEWIIDEI